MKISKKKIVLFASTLGLLVSGLSLATVAWFGGRNSIGVVDILGGAVLRGYFHSGTGTQADPFTITTPWHYENFAKLHYSMDGFAEAGYYFEFGYPLNGGTTRYFYGTDENGAVDFDVTNATTLNLGGDVFEPIGNEEKPFIGNLNGNNLTITNFEIDGSGHHDIGIFGFVGETSEGVGAKIDNAYFSDFKVNTKGATATDAHGSPETRVHSENAHVGYIAGHVVRATDINNVYVNNCTIDGKTAKDRTVDTYGYYGKVEYDHTGGQRHAGDNYSFDLSAKKIYDAINEDYANVRDNPLRARVGLDSDDMGRHYTDYDFPIEGEPDWANNEASHPVSEAITRVNGNTYRLNGTTTQEYADRTYSLSTVGYQPLTGGIRSEFEVSSTDSRWSNPDNVTTNKNAPALANQSATGDFFRYDSSGQQWYYQHSENDSTSYVAEKDITFNLSTISEFSVGESGGDSSPSMYSARAYFYIDGVKVYDEPVNNSIQRTGSVFNYKYRLYNISLTKTSFTHKLQRGTHYYAFFLAFATKNNAMRFAYIADNAKTKGIDGSNQTSSGTSVTMSGANRKNWTVRQGTFVFDVDDYIRGTMSFAGAKYDGGNCTVADQSPTIEIDSNKWDGKVPQYVNPNSYEITLTGTKRSDGSTALLKESSIESFTRETVTDIEYDDQGNPHEVSRKVWIAADNPTRSPDYSKDPVYLSDAQSLIDNNYKFKNIDIVGGNVTFYYLGTILFIPVNLEVITLPPETQNTNIVELPEMSDLDAMSQFYATKYCPGSIVMYVNNSGNGLDNIDSQLGHVEFTYANMNIQGRTLINVTRPSFKKGNGNFVNVETLGRIEEGEQYVNFVSTFDGDITESGARKTSYVCLDRQGRMLGIYDLNGNPGYGFFKAATTEPAEERYRHVTYNPGTTQYDQNPYGTYEKDPSGSYVLNKDRVSNIATYVIVLGSSSRSSTNGTYITDVKFSYKAHEGSGGSFGPVGYRDANDTITDTILNFYFDAPAELNYSIKVYFNKNDSIYYITFSASAAITINIFNYEIDNYSVYVNNVKLDDGEGHNLEVNEYHYSP
ncbi:MAG: hypothetical protein KBS97_00270 [Firmicutes bacterium]|nr:hypothetical protein [Candidatus Fiminaster equi]